MRTTFTVFGHFSSVVTCACAGPEHEPDCDFDGEMKYQAADRALKDGVTVEYDDFVNATELNEMINAQV